jgi:transcription elongation factor GreA
MSQRRQGRGTIMEKIPFTPQGLAQIKKELAHLKGTERQAVINAIAVAREHGDLSENAEYHAAREKQSFIEGRISELEDVTSRAEVIDAAKLSGDKVTFGTTVGLVDEDTDEEASYHIVGPYETDLTKRMISTSSPIARAVVGKGVGDSVEVQTPGGLKTYEILSIDLFNRDAV